MQRFPNNASPFSTTMSLLVRAGNPANIQDCSDLARQGIEIVTPHLTAAGSGRYGYLTMWAYALRAYDGDQSAVEHFMQGVLANVAIMAPGSRAAATAFLEQNQGDVLLNYESEVQLIADDLGLDTVEVVVPSIGLQVDVHAAEVVRNTMSAGSSSVVHSYIAFLYSPSAQKMIAEARYRPYDQSVARDFAHTFPDIEILTVDEVFGSWLAAEQQHFANGGSFTRLRSRL